MIRNSSARTYLKLAGRLRIELRFTASKAAVLPLDDLPNIYSTQHCPTSLFFTA